MVRVMVWLGSMLSPKIFGVTPGSVVKITSQFWEQFISMVRFLYWNSAGSPAATCSISATGVMSVLLYCKASSGTPGTSG